MQGHEDQADGTRGGVAEQVRGTGPGDGDTVPGQIQPAQVRTIANRIQKSGIYGSIVCPRSLYQIYIVI